MTESERIAKLVDVVGVEGGWHGPSFLQVLEGVDAAQAAAHPIPRAHSVWELVRHATAWHEIALRRLAGEKVELTPQVDWPPVTETGEDAWRRDVARLESVVAQTREAVLRSGDERLEEPLMLVSGTAPRWVTLHGVVHHDAWHAGQVALLRRALGVPSPTDG